MGIKMTIRGFISQPVPFRITKQKRELPSTKLTFAMKFWMAYAAVAIGVTMVTLAVALEPNQPVPYSLNIFFVPPIMAAKCPLGQFWYPTTMVCSMCFCLTGGLSRCVPEPGCNPSEVTTATPATDVSGVTPVSVISGSNSTISSVTERPANSTVAVNATTTPAPAALPQTNLTTTHPAPGVRRSRSPRFDMFNNRD